MECCGTCGNNCYDGGEFVCSCEASDAYGCPTAYNDTCNEWCEKGDNENDRKRVCRVSYEN